LVILALVISLSLACGIDEDLLAFCWVAAERSDLESLGEKINVDNASP
jgi:hypothetical protein